MEIERVSVESLTGDPANMRTHDGRNVEAIAASLRRFGQQKPIVVDEDGVVRAGNGTLEAARTLGWTEIDVVTTSLESVEAVAYAIADNRTAELASWDDRGLAQQLQALAEQDLELFQSVGFSDDELAVLLGAIDPAESLEEDDVPEPPDDPVTRRGDLWILGDHRLLCGDSASPDDVDRLLDGKPVHLVNTDPPYNVKVEPRSNNAHQAGSKGLKATNAAGKTTEKLRAKDRPLANDFVSDEEFDRLVDAWFGNLSRVLLPGHSFYIWGGGYPGSGGAKGNHETYPQFMRTHGLKYAQLIIWDKEHPVLTRKDFMGAHESCFYGWKEGAAHRFFGPNNISDLWHLKKVNPQSMVHLTEKPVELAARAIQYSSKPGENVLDLFGGSGSTLMACQQTSRRGYLMEIDPLYADVIVRRWESHTGKEAERHEAVGHQAL